MYTGCCWCDMECPLRRGLRDTDCVPVAQCPVPAGIGCMLLDHPCAHGSCHYSSTGVKKVHSSPRMREDIDTYGSDTRLIQFWTGCFDGLAESTSYEKGMYRLKATVCLRTTSCIQRTSPAHTSLLLRSSSAGMDGPNLNTYIVAHGMLRAVGRHAIS